MTSEKIIVLVCDKEDSKHGEISILEDPQKAERLVETLLEAGFEEERIRVFSGKASEFQISHRPVVALVDRRQEESQPMVDGAAPGATVDQPVAEEPAAEEPAAAAGAVGGGGEEEAVIEAEEEKQQPAAEMTAPIRFSSLFRSA